MLVSLSSLNWACPFRSEWKEILMKRLLAGGAAAALVAGGLSLATASTASASPEWCPDNSVVVFNFGGGYCDWDFWPDGSFMHAEWGVIFGIWTPPNIFRACQVPPPLGRVITDDDPATPC